jgi:hypothetical protein
VSTPATPPVTGFINLADRLKTFQKQWTRLRWQLMCDLKVAVPAVVVSFNPDTQCIRAQVAIEENLNINSVSTPSAIPILGGAQEGDEDIPVVFFRSGGIGITFPVQPGDECLLIFSDMPIDSWWQSGGTNNVQVMRRRHNISDGFAIVGIWSQPNVLPNYSESTAQLRTDSGDTYLEVIEGNVNVEGNLNASNGATGSFSTADGQTATFINGILVNLG